MHNWKTPPAEWAQIIVLWILLAVSVTGIWLLKRAVWEWMGV